MKTNQRSRPEEETGEEEQPVTLRDVCDSPYLVLRDGNCWASQESVGVVCIAGSLSFGWNQYLLKQPNGNMMIVIKKINTINTNVCMHTD